MMEEVSACSVRCITDIGIFICSYWSIWGCVIYVVGAMQHVKVLWPKKHKSWPRPNGPLSKPQVIVLSHVSLRLRHSALAAVVISLNLNSRNESDPPSFLTSSLGRGRQKRRTFLWAEKVERATVHSFAMLERHWNRALTEVGIGSGEKRRSSAWQAKSLLGRFELGLSDGNVWCVCRNSNSRNLPWKNRPRRCIWKEFTHVG